MSMTKGEKAMSESLRRVLDDYYKTIKEIRPN